MALNAIRNSVFLFYLFLVMFALGLVYLILSPLVTDTASVMHTANLDNPISTKAFLAYQDQKNFIISSFYVLVSLLVALSWVTSFVDRTNFFSYMVNAIGALIITPVLIYIAATFWNDFSLLGITMSEVRNDFIMNWGIVMTVNFFLGLMSFLFVKRGVEQ